MAEQEQPTAPRTRSAIRIRGKEKAPAWKDAPCKLADISAVKAVHAGSATPEQQKRALDWILKVACMLPEWPYFPDQRQTDIALGRHFVGHQIMQLIQAPLSTMRRSEVRADAHDPSA